ncbi:MAG: hypothetical protein QM758_10620 [Armatimonas sp.]
MQICSEAEGFERLVQLGYYLQYRSKYKDYKMYKNYKMVFSTKIPDISGRRTAIARFVAHEIFEKEDVIFSIDATGIFESCENLYLFHTFRQGLGINIAIGETPCHLLNAAESDILESLTALSLYFYWDFSIFSLHKKCLIECTHDDGLELFCDEPSLTDRFKDWSKWLSNDSVST